MAEPLFSFHTIGDGSPYVTRLIIGRLRLHIFHRGDGDPDPHDHPWSFWTLPLTPYVEEVTAQTLAEWPAPGDLWRVVRNAAAGDLVYQRIVPAWRLSFRKAEHTHRVLGRWSGKDFGVMSGPIVTLVWRGKGGRRWGFLKTRGGRSCWQHWKEYVLRGGKHAPCEPVERAARQPDGAPMPADTHTREGGEGYSASPDGAGPPVLRTEPAGAVSASGGSPSRMTWQPIGTAPRNATTVLLGWYDKITSDRKDWNWIAIAGWYEAGPADRCWYDIFDERVDPTHWMPLPPAPQEYVLRGGKHAPCEPVEE